VTERLSCQKFQAIERIGVFIKPRRTGVRS
jgi:hypothetical protein